MCIPFNNASVFCINWISLICLCLVWNLGSDLNFLQTLVSHPSLPSGGLSFQTTSFTSPLIELKRLCADGFLLELEFQTPADSSQWDLRRPHLPCFALWFSFIITAHRWIDLPNPVLLCSVYCEFPALNNYILVFFFSFLFFRFLEMFCSFVLLNRFIIITKYLFWLKCDSLTRRLSTVWMPNPKNWDNKYVVFVGDAHFSSCCAQPCQNLFFFFFTVFRIFGDWKFN